MKALIDGDILLYRIGYTTEEENEGIAAFRMDEKVQDVLGQTKSTDHCIFFSDNRENTFRAKLYPEYKANRTQPKPKHYDFLKEYLTKNFNVKHEVGQEADDGLGIAQYDDLLKNPTVAFSIDTEDCNTIICSIDKDLLQIPGNHFNFVKNEFHFVTEEEGLLFFYKQLLMGDTVDNIKGVTGIGKAKAAKILDHLLGEDERVLFQTVRRVYRDWLQHEWKTSEKVWSRFEERQLENIILLTGQLLKIRTREGELWTLPESMFQETEPHS